MQQPGILNQEIQTIFYIHTKTEVFKNSSIYLSRKRLVQSKTSVSFYFSEF